VGDIPLALQPKLLRVLQEQEFERLGGTRTIKWTFVWWLPPRNLVEMVKRNEFRSDLYYRLNVFPIRCHRCESAAKTFGAGKTLCRDLCAPDEQANRVRLP